MDNLHTSCTSTTILGITQLKSIHNIHFAQETRGLLLFATTSRVGTRTTTLLCIILVRRRIDGGFNGGVEIVCTESTHHEQPISSLGKIDKDRIIKIKNKLRIRGSEARKDVLRATCSSMTIENGIEGGIFIPIKTTHRTIPIFLICSRILLMIVHAIRCLPELCRHSKGTQQSVD